MVWSPAPAPRSLSLLRTEVGNFVYAPSDTSLADSFIDYINGALDRIATRERWPWLLVSENITLVTGTAAYELATSSAKKIRHVHLLDTADKEKSALQYKDPKTFLLDHADRATNGSPGFYTVFNMIADGKIDLSVPPDANFTAKYPKLKVRLLRRMTRFGSTSLTDTITTLGGGPPELESFLLWHAKAMAASVHYPEKSNFAFQQAEKMWTALIADSNREADFD